MPFGIDAYDPLGSSCREASSYRSPMPRPNRPCSTVMCSSVGCQWGGTLVPAASLILSVNGAPACDGSPSTRLTCGGSVSSNAGVPSMRSADMGVQRNASGLTAMCAARDEDAVELLRLRFGVFEIDRRTGEVRRQGVRIKVAAQPFQILSTLVDRPGELVTREELRQRLWPSDTFVDFEHSLNSAVKKLRLALGDMA